MRANTLHQRNTRRSVLAIGIGIASLVCASSSSLAAPPTIGMISAVAALAGAANKSSEVDLGNAKLTNDVKVDDSFVVGPTGIVLKGKKINAKSAVLDNKVHVKGSAVFGASGISVGD